MQVSPPKQCILRGGGGLSYGARTLYLCLRKGSGFISPLINKETPDGKAAKVEVFRGTRRRGLCPCDARGGSLRRMALSE